DPEPFDGSRVYELSATGFDASDTERITAEVGERPFPMSRGEAYSSVIIRHAYESDDGGDVFHVWLKGLGVWRDGSVRAGGFGTPPTKYKGFVSAEGSMEIPLDDCRIYGVVVMSHNAFQVSRSPFGIDDQKARGVASAVAFDSMDE